MRLATRLALPVNVAAGFAAQRLEFLQVAGSALNHAHIQPVGRQLPGT